ncbi:MAG: PKD repeat protein [Polaribacter sp.]|jgi:PKD repeat protein
MKNIYILLTIFFVGILFHSCNDNEYPVPPASTVPMFDFFIDNEDLAPANVIFTNNSIVPADVGEATFYWNFGDNTSSKEKSPVHLYKNPGVYIVSLVVSTATSLEIKEVIKTIVIKDPSATGTPIYYTDGSQLYQALINDQVPVFSSVGGVNMQSSYNMALDTVHKKIYISDYGADKIYRANLDGSNFEDFRTDVDQPNGLSIDYQENQIYWDTSSGIQRGNLNDADVNQVENFVTGQSNDPDGLSVDVTNRKLYWINYNGDIGVKNLDGTGERILIAAVEGGTIKVIKDRIYYDEYIGSGDIRLKSASLDGTNVTTIAVGIGRVVYGIGYDPDEDKIYWGDRSTDVLMRANLDGSNPETWFSSTSDTRGIVIGQKQ